MPTKQAIATETIARVTAACAIPKGVMTSYETAKACFCSLAAYVVYIEDRMMFSRFEIAYADEGYRLYERRK